MKENGARFRRDLRRHVNEIIRLAEVHKREGWSDGASEWLEDAANELLDAANGYFDAVPERRGPFPAEHTRGD